jgi:Flp pilus assembly protein TadD
MKLGTVLLRQKEFSAAREQLTLAQTMRPKDPETLVLLGVAYAGEQKWAEAEKHMESALALAPRNYLALTELTALLTIRNQQAKAVALLQRYTTSYPDDAHGHLLLGSMYRRARDDKKAEAEFARAVQLAPRHEQARLMLGGVLYDQGLIDAAIVQLEEAVKQQPRSISLHLLLGQARLKNGQGDAARKHFEDALAIDPKSAVAANNVAFMYANTGGDLDAALALAQKAHDLAPNMLEAADTLGWIQYKKGWHQRAIPLFEECVKRAPNSAMYQYHLGMALLAAGQKQRSRGYLQAAVQMKLDPEDLSHAREALAKTR